MENVVVSIPPGLPSSLLERRPDIAAAERAMAAANARIGMAKAAFFPKLDLTASGGFESAELGRILIGRAEPSCSDRWWRSVVVAAFDGGARRAQLDYRLAQYEEDVAIYRQTVLTAFREVEDGLAGVRFLKTRAVAQEAARAAAQRTTELARLQYREGHISQLDVIDAERSFLSHQLAASRLRGEQARTVVQLVRALGGGWMVESHADETKQDDVKQRLLTMGSKRAR